MFWFKTQKSLEKKIEDRIIESYKKWDIARCYNLMKLMMKVNKNNKVLLNYLHKIDKKKLKKYRSKRALSSSGVWSFLTSPKLYITVILLYLTWQFK